jgi:hypothetical protein
VNHRGPAPSEVPYPCPRCGKLRWYTPREIAGLKGPLCNSCRLKQQYDTGERVPPNGRRKK